MRKIVLLMALLITSVIAFSQERSVSGRVIDETGAPVPYATVRVSNSTVGVSADGEGRFTIRAVPGASLVVSAAGYSTSEIKVPEAGEITVTINSNSTLSEVVVTALGIERTKRSVGYSTQSVSEDELNKIRPTDISAALAGKVAGLQVLGTPSSNFGEGNVRLRGVNSLTPNNPIYVVDGTVVNLNAINLDDVASVTVLKGPSATALYGFRGAGGVVMITTKKGKKGEPSVTVNSLTEIGHVSMLPKYQNEYGGGYSQEWTIFHYNPSIHPAEWAAFEGQKLVEYNADESWGPRMDGTLVREWFSWYPGEDFGKLTPFEPHPNAVRDFYENTLRTNNNIVFEAGGDYTNFRLSYNNRITTLPFPNTRKNENLIGVRAGLNKGKFSVGTNMNFLILNQIGDRTEGYTNDGQNIAQNFNQWWQRQLDIKKLRDYKNPAGGYKTWNIRAPHDTRAAYWDNMYYQVYESYRRVWQNRIYGDISLGYQILDNLKANVIFRTNVLNYGGDGRVASYGLELDSYSINNGQTGEYNGEFLLEYKKNWGKFSWEQYAGANVRRDFRKHNAASTVGGLAVPDLYSITASIDRPSVSNTWNEYEIRSMYARGTFGWNNLIYLDYSLRNDWSSALPKNNNSYLYPSFSASFVFSDLLKESRISNALSFGKLRAAYGRVGSDLGAYSLNETYGLGTPYGSNPTMSVPTTVYDPNIKPALSKEYEIGTELQFFKNRLGVDFSWYQKDGVDMILPLTVTPSSGSATIYINAGLIRSKGWDLILSGVPVKTADFTWDVSVNFARNISEVIDLDTARNIRNYSLGTASFGPSVNARVGERYGAFVGRKMVVDEKTGLPVLDNNNLPTYTSNEILGYALPDYIGGGVTTFTYKNWQLSGSFSFQSGGQFFSTTHIWLHYSGLHANTAGLNDKGNPLRDPVSQGGGVRVDGIKNGVQVTEYVDAMAYFGNYYPVSSYNMMDASYVKLTELRLGYTIPVSNFSNTIKKASVQFFVRNPWLIHAKTKDFGIDPSELENANAFYEGGQLPPVRSYGLNISFGF